MPNDIRGKKRKLKVYNKDDLEAAFVAVKEEKMSIREASRKFNVPRTTLGDHIMERHGTTNGRKPELSAEEEKMIVERVKLLGVWGFPFTSTDLCHFVKIYLDKKGAITRFINNLPGHRFVARFLGRHPELRLRMTTNIKRARARVSREEVVKFFENFQEAVEGVPPENLWNFDETNFQDDPKSKKCLFKKGTRYCERVMNSSKQAISVMFCGNATGTMLPPMVVYKALNLYTSWCERGPRGTVYACSKSGWFDGCLFERWFLDLLLPKLKRQPGKKLVLCDNLSSHLSVSVIDACRGNDIAFVCLPAHSTDKLQPLDVGIFGPLKKYWRTTLTDYKLKNPQQAGLNKTDFPRLLEETLQKAQVGRHLPAAFEKCGLHPLNQERAMQRIPHRSMTTESEDIRDLMNSSLGEKLEQLRGVGDGQQVKKQRGKKIKVPAGKSYTAEEEKENSDPEEVDEPEDVEAEDSEVESETEDSVEEDEEDEELPDPEPVRRTVPYPVGSFVAAVYDGKWFVAQVHRKKNGLRYGTGTVVTILNGFGNIFAFLTWLSLFLVHYFFTIQ
jgi:hypothetical protein